MSYALQTQGHVLAAAPIYGAGIAAPSDIRPDMDIPVSEEEDSQPKLSHSGHHIITHLKESIQATFGPDPYANTNVEK